MSESIAKSVALLFASGLLPSSMSLAFAAEDSVFAAGKWFIPYSVNAGSGESDFNWGAYAGLGYKFSDLSAIFGWRYLDYDVGSDTIIKELTLNGPFAGAVFHW